MIPMFSKSGIMYLFNSTARQTVGSDLSLQNTSILAWVSNDLSLYCRTRCPTTIPMCSRLCFLGSKNSRERDHTQGKKVLMTLMELIPHTESLPIMYEP